MKMTNRTQNIDTSFKNHNLVRTDTIRKSNSYCLWYQSMFHYFYLGLIKIKYFIAGSTEIWLSKEKCRCQDKT